MDDEFRHFIEAQDKVLGLVENELKRGQKRGHWIWFIFPQLAGLGHSDMSKRFAIRDLHAARRYLTHPVLGSRLERHVTMMMEHDRSVEAILGWPDDLKFRSCLTLFLYAAENSPHACLFRQALLKYFAEAPDVATMEILGTPWASESQERCGQIDPI